jgi:hypothetical protein
MISPLGVLKTCQTLRQNAAHIMTCMVVISRSASLDRDTIVSYLVDELASSSAAKRFLDALDQMGAALG